MQEIKIADKRIGMKHKPFIIAEMSGNHNQSLEKAMAIIKAASEAGADAIKLQTYTPDSLTIDHREGLFNITDKNSLWHGKNLYDLYKEAMTPYEWHKPLFEYSKELGLICFSTPFDIDAVDMLEDLGAPAYKIASFENNYHGLLRKIASMNKPVIMSTGISELRDLVESVDVLENSGCKELALLKCTSTYPASPLNSNVRTIPHMRELFNCEIGLSDHTMGVGVAIAAITLGATIIEKHFCLSRAEGGVDSNFSLEPNEFKCLVVESERAWQSLGHVFYGIQDVEKNSLNYKRSLYVISDIKEGELFSIDNVRVIRPGDGLHPKFYNMVIGKKAKKDINKGTPLNMDLF
jgi:N-acetylneuraminate synthase